jgi:hypothetical protein
VVKALVLKVCSLQGPRFNTFGCIQSFVAIVLGEFNCLLNYLRCTCRKLLVEGLCTPRISQSKCFGHPVPIKKKKNLGTHELTLLSLAFKFHG